MPRYPTLNFLSLFCNAPVAKPARFCNRRLTFGPPFLLQNLANRCNTPVAKTTWARTCQPVPCARYPIISAIHALGRDKVAARLPRKPCTGFSRPVVHLRSDSAGLDSCKLLTSNRLQHHMQSRLRSKCTKIAHFGVHWCILPATSATFRDPSGLYTRATNANSFRQLGWPP